jgi:hypothetical protein
VTFIFVSFGDRSTRLLQVARQLALKVEPALLFREGIFFRRVPPMQIAYRLGHSTGLQLRQALEASRPFVVFR